MNTILPHTSSTSTCSTSTTTSATLPLQSLDDRIATAITTTLYYNTASYDTTTHAYTTNTLLYNTSSSSSSSRSNVVQLHSESILAPTQVDEAPLVFHSFHRDSQNPDASVVYIQHVCRADVQCLVELQTGYVPPVLSILLQYPTTILVDSGSAVSTAAITSTSSGTGITTAVANSSGSSGDSSNIPHNGEEEWDHSVYTTTPTTTAATTTTNTSTTTLDRAVSIKLPPEQQPTAGNLQYALYTGSIYSILLYILYAICISIVNYVLIYYPLHYIIFTY